MTVKIISDLFIPTLSKEELWEMREPLIESDPVDMFAKSYYNPEEETEDER